MENNWINIWNNRKVDLENINSNDEQKLILELKKIAGFDSYGKGTTFAFEEIFGQYKQLKNNLQLPQIGGSVFEVGCGSGAYLYFFKKDGFKVGGLDYAENILKVTREIIGEKNLIECICATADKIPTEIKYDAIFSGCVFQYFDSIEYAEKVLDLMLEKTAKSIGLLEIFNKEIEDEYFAYRRKNDANYDEHYKGLPKLFISKKFFENYAAKNNLEVKFEPCKMESYWNAPFIYDCFMYKK